jgi:ATP-dependent DNA ligase
MKAGDTFDGELVCYKDGKLLDRKTGNGIINKAIKGTITPEETKMLRMVCWDHVDFSGKIPYSKRLLDVEAIDTTIQDKIIPVESVVVNSEEEAVVFFEKCLAAGEEGAIIKNTNAVWQPKRTKDCGKMKAENVGDLRVIGINPGTGKYEGMMGSLQCETEDHLLECAVSGFTDDFRKSIDETFIGTIISVTYNAIISNKSSTKKSLFLPRFDCVRYDKDKANTLEELK